MGFRQEKMPAMVTKTLKFKGFAKTEGASGWGGHMTAPHLHFGSVHWTQPTPSLQFVSNFQLEISDPVFASSEQNFPRDAVPERSPLKPGSTFAVSHVQVRLCLLLKGSELCHIWMKVLAPWGHLFSPQNQLSWGNTSGCTPQLPNKYFRASLCGLAQHGFYSTIRVLLWDSPLAMGRFLLETRLPLCHLW